jgi:hypothetical protein
MITPAASARIVLQLTWSQIRLFTNYYDDVMNTGVSFDKRFFYTLSLHCSVILICTTPWARNKTAIKVDVECVGHYKKL